jgi:glycerol kinase
VLYQKDESSKPVYAFEGAVECGGSTINWARDQLCNHSAKQQELFHNYDDLSQSVASVDDSDGVYFVPAFSGLYSPYWNEEATGYFSLLNQAP